MDWRWMWGESPIEAAGRSLILPYESDPTFGCSASVVRRWRVLLWRTCLRRRRSRPGFVDRHYRLSCGRIPHEELTGRHPRKEEKRPVAKIGESFRVFATRRSSRRRQQLERPRFDSASEVPPQFQSPMRLPATVATASLPHLLRVPVQACLQVHRVHSRSNLNH